MAMYCDFGGTLSGLRKSRNLTQKEFGAKVGLSKAVVSKYENGIGYPNFDILIRIAQFFGVTTDYLLGIESNCALNISGLTEEQTNILRQLVREFQEANRK